MRARTLPLGLTPLLAGGSAWAAGSFPPHHCDSPWSFVVIDEPSSRFVVNDADRLVSLATQLRNRL